MRNPLTLPARSSKVEDMNTDTDTDNNLPTRLRNQCDYYSRDLPGSVISDMHDAADEMERLYAEVNDAADEIERLNALISAGGVP